MKKKGKKKKKKKNRKEQTNDASYCERLRAKWLCCAFKLGILQLICKAYLIFKCNLESALSAIFQKRELYKSKHVVVERRCIKI